MDYSPFFAHPPQPYQFVGMPPTPSYTGEEKIVRTPLMPDMYSEYSQGLQDALDTAMFAQPYDAFRYSLMPSSQGEMTAPGIGMPIGSVDSGLGSEGMNSDLLQDAPNGSQNPNSAGGPDARRSSSEEKDLTPAQSRRKAQNRAAQRAFRERKERHVKDLEAKLSALENSATSLASDNQRLKLALQRATTENELLRQQTTSSRPLSTSSHQQSPGSTSPTADPLLANDPLYSTPSPHTLSSVADGDGRLLPAGATWDLIQSHPLVRQGHVDIADVCERLRHATRCDGAGPVFAEREVRRAVEESRRGGGDELI